ncbi:MAG: hypothetical protein O3A93_13175 [Chloroflexi bacterium]|nr:hypothetical protein [Chloroflexota bacterium]MDA1272184.1 hypothetical protein [Chloroflexota bacterium]PKB58890.1 MAG: hypothetical protein BZY83_04735 [SAR202 cluster bacterium Casp-Chloro-G2]
MLGRKRAIISGLLLLAVALTACGGSDGPVSPAGAEPGYTTISLFEELLFAVPDTPDTRKFVMINDYAAAREILGVPETGPDAELPALMQHIIDSVGQDSANNTVYMAPGTLISGMGQGMWDRPLRPYLAFDVRNVDQSVEAGAVPFVLELLRGRFDPEATAQALAACSECPPPDMKTHNGVSFYSWGEDGQGSLQGRYGPPAFDHLGRGGRIAVSSDYVYRTVETPGMQALIDANIGLAPTLAEVEEIRLLSRAMSGLGAYSAFLSHETHRISRTPNDTSTFGPLPGTHDKLIAEIGRSTLLLPYLSFATGAGKDETGPYMALALVHGDAGSAEENARRLERRIAENEELQPWMEGLEGVEIKVEGRLLSAKLRGDRPASGWRSLVFFITPLIPHE